MRTALHDQGTELLGSRIVELPEDESGLRRRDAHSGFIAYVPEGSLARGKILTTTTEWGVPCTACHGKTLNGLGGVPPLSRAAADLPGAPTLEFSKRRAARRHVGADAGHHRAAPRR